MIDFVGRKFALMITALPFTAGWLTIGMGKSAVALCIGRFLSGVGVGMASLCVPVRIARQSLFLSVGAGRNLRFGTCSLGNFKPAYFSLPQKHSHLLHKRHELKDMRTETSADVGSRYQFPSILNKYGRFNLRLFLCLQ